MSPEGREAARARRQLWRQLNRARKYGMTREQFEAMLDAQGGCCAICDGRLTVVCIDHDHRTNAVRGLLCFSCNVGIGHLRDDPTIVRNALAYLTRLRKLEQGRA
jgi:Recombination endonuclease VII